MEALSLTDDERTWSDVSFRLIFPGGSGALRRQVGDTHSIVVIVFFMTRLCVNNKHVCMNKFPTIAPIPPVPGDSNFEGTFYKLVLRRTQEYNS